MWKNFGSLATIAACLAFSSTAMAQEAAECATRITRTNVVPCALTASLTVRGEQKTVDALQGRRTANGVFLPSNPTLALSGARRNLTGGAADATNWYATLSQEVELAGQRASRLRASDAAIVAQEKRVLLSKRETAVLAWSAFFEALAASEQQRLTDRLLQTSQRMGVVARARAEKGVGASLDADLADAATLRLLQIKLAADLSVTAANARLSFLLGRDPSSGVVGVEGDLIPLAGLPDARAALLGERPEVQVVDAERRAMRSRAEAFRRSRIPNPTLSVFVQNDGFNERVVGLGVAVPIPLPAPVGRTYAGEIAEADALAQRAEIERTRVERELRLEIVDATATYTAHRLAVEAMTPERMRRAEDSLRDLQVEIEAGRLGVREALVAQQTLIEMLQTNIAQRRALCLASVDLARALGVPLEGGAR